MSKINLPRLLISLALPFLVGAVGSYFTFPSIVNWYANLIKPAFSPPNWIFGPVWTLLYFMMGISLYLIWQKGTKSKEVRIAVKYFFLQLFFNFLWSILFFGLHSPPLAFIDIILLWSAILITINKFYPLSNAAAYLLIPYLLWVSFASLLNLSIVLLNP